jgi:hypothetical protein
LSRSNFLPQFTHVSFYGEHNSCSQYLQLTQSIQSSSFIDHSSFPGTHGTSFQNIQLFLDYKYLFLLAFFSAFSDCVDLKYWGAVFTFDFSALCISSLLVSRFLEIISFFSDKEESCYNSIEYFLGIFGTGLIFFRRLEEVIS